MDGPRHDIYPAGDAAAGAARLSLMDNYPISIFLSDTWHKTLPIQMLQYLDETPHPTLTAISSGLLLLTIIVLLVADRLVGLRHLAEF